MIDIYVKLVKAGLPIEKVPIKWREAVRQALEREQDGE